MSAEKLDSAPDTQLNGQKRAKGKRPGDVQGQVEGTTEQTSARKPKDTPAGGGYDETPIPLAEDGYTVRFTFHRAENLPVSDLNSRSSDPYIHATLTSPLPKRHKEDPDTILRNCREASSDFGSTIPYSVVLLKLYTREC